MGMFDDLIPQKAQYKPGAFDDLIPKPSPVGGALDGAANLARGLARSGRDLIDGPAYLLPKGIEKVARFVGAEGLADWAAKEASGVSDINKQAEAEYQAATPGSVAAGTGRVAGNVASAFIPGTGQAKAVQMVNDLWKAGGAANTAKSLAVASGLGATQNALLGTKTEDDSLPVNAAVGAVLAPVAQLAGAGSARTIQAGRNMIAGESGRVGRVLQRAGQDSPEALAAQIRAGNVEIVPGSAPTTAQAAMNPGISQLARTVKNQGHRPLSEAEAAQNSTRIAALDGVAPGATGMTSIEAAQNAGDVIRDQAGELRQVLREAIRGAYNDPKLANASLMMPDRTAARAAVEQFYPGKAYDSAPIELKRMVARLSTGEVVSLKEFDALRKFVGNRAADLADTDRTAAAAFSSMKSLFNDAEEAAVAGMVGRAGPGAKAPALTPEQGAQLRAARGLFTTLKNRYETGASADLWRTGRDGQPVKQGAEVARGFFGSANDQAARMDQFANMMPGNDEAWRALRGYGVADLAEKATGPTGNLSSPKLGSWLDRHSEAINRLFSQDQQQAIGNVRRDSARAFEAENLGRATGSNTVQNQLGAGYLDTRLASLLASFIPRVGPAGLDAMRNASRQRSAQEVGQAMLNPEAAAGSLDVLTRLLQPNTAQRGMGRLPQVAVPAVSSVGAN